MQHLKLGPALTAIVSLIAIGTVLEAQDFNKPKREKPTVKILAIRPDKSEVKTGEIFKVAFDLEIPPTWHIYPAAKEPLLGKRTIFSFENAEIAGPLQEPKPKIVKEEGIGNSDYHEGKITITVPLKLKPDAKPGPVEVKGKIDYQICDPNICVDNTTPVAFTVTLFGGGAAPEPQDPAIPTVKILSVKPSKSEVKVGEVFVVAFETEIPKGWHIYPTVPTTTGELTVFDLAGAEVAGKIEEPAPKVHPKERGVDAYEYHEGAIPFKVPFRLKAGAKAGPLELKGAMSYQICDAKNCWPGVQTPIAFGVTVQDGGAGTAPGAEPNGRGAAEQAATNELEKEGLGGFFLLAMGGGLLSLVMPCVYPLIPITITYFVKQGAGSRRKSLALSTAYALGIILAFTLVGFAFSMILGAAGAREFAANAWVNIGVSALFFWFTFSLFGLYDISLPSWLTGSLTGKARSGVGGAFILGGLFSIVTFTCTIPIAATILAVAASAGGANRFIGLLAMVVYATTMAIPFFVLGLFPGLLTNVRKGGGDWLHTVKVTAGFAELALALFYLAKADQVLGWSVLTRPVMISVWVAVLGAMALYLLRLFQLKGDEADPEPAPEGGAPVRRQVGVARMLIAIFLAVNAVFIAGGFSGKPLGFWDIVLPVGESKAEFDSLPEAQAEAKKTGKPVFVEFTGVT